MQSGNQVLSSWQAAVSVWVSNSETLPSLVCRAEDSISAVLLPQQQLAACRGASSQGPPSSETQGKTLQSLLPCCQLAVLGMASSSSGGLVTLVCMTAVRGGCKHALQGGSFCPHV